LLLSVNSVQTTTTTTTTTTFWEKLILNIAHTYSVSQYVSQVKTLSRPTYLHGNIYLWGGGGCILLGTLLIIFGGSVDRNSTFFNIFIIFHTH
jgi:hypothetical protein